MKLYFSILFALLLSCQTTEKENPFNAFSDEERIKLSKSYYEKSAEHGQGSTTYFAYLDSAILANPKNALAYKEKSVWFSKTGQHLKAMGLVNKAVELDPNELGYRGWLKLYWLRDYIGAIEDLTAFDNLTPTTDYPMGDNLFFTRGLAKKQNGDLQGAIDDFNKCIETDGTKGEEWISINVFLYKGISLYQMKKFDEALVNFNKVLKYYDKCADAYYYKGLTLKYLGHNKESESNFKEALKYGQMGYLQRDPYIEVFDQLYISDIEEAMTN